MTLKQKILTLIKYKETLAQVSPDLLGLWALAWLACSSMAHNC